MKVETVFNRYSISYIESIQEALNLGTYDLICITDTDFSKNKNLLIDGTTPFVIIGEKNAEGSVGFILRSELVRLWHNFIKEIA